MRPIFLSALLVISSFAWAQTPRFESKELTCRVLSIEPGYSFAFERIIVDISGEEDFFAFHPSNGKLIVENVKPGQTISIRVTFDLRGKKSFEKSAKDNKEFRKAFWYLCRNMLDEIKIGTEWIKLKAPDEPYNASESSGTKFAQDKEMQQSNKEGQRKYQVFLDQAVVSKYDSDGKTYALIFKNGLVFYNQMLDHFSDFYGFKDTKPGDLVSFVGTKLRQGEGYRYPAQGVKEAYYSFPLRKESGRLKALLFKQNHVCIGVRLQRKKGEELSVSFPSDRAMTVKKFIDPDKELRVYYGPYSVLDKHNLPELHAIIQETDTLFIKEAGFYGGADIEHDHEGVEFGGKITGITKTKKGNIESFIVDSQFYIEFDAMMAQLIGHTIEKGKKVIIQGKERVKKIGEIYDKDYRLIIPQKITIDGTTFSAYKP